MTGPHGSGHVNHARTAAPATRLPIEGVLHGTAGIVPGPMTQAILHGVVPDTPSRSSGIHRTVPVVPHPNVAGS